MESNHNIADTRLNVPVGETPTYEELITRIRASRDSLRPAERRVADVVLADIESSVRASNSMLARAAKVSEPTVTRFCRTMGCEGVRDFKIRLAQCLAANSQSAAIASEVQESKEHPYWNAVFGQAVEAVASAERQLDQSAAHSAIDIVAKAERIFAFGLGGGSTVLAQDLQFRLFRFGLAITAYPDTYLMRMAAATAGPNDAVVAISATGRTRELLEAVQLASGNGAKVVAITKPNTELANAADVSLTADVPEIVNLMKPTASRFAFLAIADLLATGVAYRLGPQGQETWRRVKLNLMRMREDDVLEPLGD